MEALSASPSREQPSREQPSRDTPTARLAMPHGSTVEVNLFDGPPLFGVVDIFDPRAPNFLLRRPAGSAHVRQVVPFERVRHVAFMRRAEPRSAPATCASSARLVELGLLDGSILRGITHCHGGQRRGLFLVPTGVPGVERFYVPATAIREILSVRSLAELLQSGGPVTSERVETALRRQDAARRRQENGAGAASTVPGAAAATKPKLGEILLAQGFISREELGDALQAQESRRGRRLGELLIDLGLASHKMVGIALSIQYQVPFLSLAGRRVDPALRAIVPAELARRLQAMPIEHEPDRITVAVVDPGADGFAEELQTATGLAIDAVVATPQEIARALAEFYGAAEEPERPAAA